MLQSDSPVRASAAEPLFQKAYAYVTNVMQHRIPFVSQMLQSDSPVRASAVSLGFKQNHDC